MLMSTYAYLGDLELYLREMMEDKQPQILAEILISEEQTNELGKALGRLLGYKMQRKVQDAYPLSASIFLVWCTIYNYKDGTLWDPIFARLGIARNAKDCVFLGELFLATISEYNLLPAPDTGKRYLTPIVMHGYISDHYAKRLLDYLNAVYISYLEYNVTDSALEKLWSELFNISEEQVNLRDRLEQLTEQENQLRSRSGQMEIPAILYGHRRRTIEQHQREAGTRHADLVQTEQRLFELDQQIEGMELLRGEFDTCKTAFTTEQPDGPVEGDVWDEIHHLGRQISSEFDRRLEEFDSEHKALKRQLYTYKNSLSIAKDRSVVLMTAVVKLGGGDIEKGYTELEEHYIIQNELQAVLRQRGQLQSLLEHEHEFGNTSIPSILTTSLTSLGQADIRLFQGFIQSTLSMLDAIWKGQPFDEEHRICRSLKSWYEDRGRPTLEEVRSEVSKASRVRGEPQPRKVPSKARISHPRLQAPYLQYDDRLRELVLVVPEQKLQVPKGICVQPEYFVDYNPDRESVPIRCHRTPKSLSIGSVTVPVRSADLRGLQFKLLSIFEYWHLSLGPVMVFDDAGQLVDDTQLRNGLFYMIARNDWIPICDSIVDSHSLNVPDYAVYEVQLVESSIAFRSSGSEDIVFHGSRHKGLSLEGVNLLPGVTQDGLPVGKGSPYLLLSRSLGGISTGDIMFRLDYNGGRMYDITLEKVIAEFGEEHTPEVIKLDLEKMVPLTYWRPNWETFEARLTDDQGEIVCQAAVAMVKGLSVAYDSDRLIINVPSRSRLEHPEASSQGKAHVIPTVDSPLIDVRVFFDRIGWKSFSIEVPGGKCQLISTDGEVLEQPLCLLKSEIHRLHDVEMRFTARNSLVRRVAIFDQEEALHMTFHLSKRAVAVSLGSFVDLWRDLDGDSQIWLQWEGETGSAGLMPLVKVYEKLQITQAEIFQSEQEDQHVLELSIASDFPHPNRLLVRMREEGNPHSLILDRSFRGSPDYFYIRKNELHHMAITVELYYVEQHKSIFGDESVEQICWTHTLALSSRKTRLKQAMDQGIILSGFSYDDCHYSLPTRYYISDIQLSPKRFEGEELLRGVIQSTSGPLDVYFYLDDEANILPYLWDEDDDGVQYDLDVHEIFWEMRDARNVMAPLDNLEFEFGKVDNE